MSWAPVQRTGVALYSFEANGEHQVSLGEGAEVYVDAELSGWYRGTVLGKPGIFPVSYIRLAPPLAPPQKQPIDAAAASAASASASTSASAAHSSAAPPTPPKKQRRFSGSVSIEPKIRPPAMRRLSRSDGDSRSSQHSPSRRAHSIVSSGPAFGEDGEKALCSEIAAVMKTWRAEARQHLQDGRFAEHKALVQRTAVLAQLRRRLFVVDASDDLELSFSKKHHHKLQQDLIELLESSRRNAHGFMVPRTHNHEAASVQNTGVMQLLKMHKDMFVALQREASTLWQQKIDERRAAMCSKSAGAQESLIDALPDGPLKLGLDVKACVFSVGQSTQVYFRLFDSTADSFISEEYVVQLTSAGMPQDIALLGKLKSVFLGLDKASFKNHLYLVVHIYRVGALLKDAKTAKKKRARDYRRPFGCAVLPLHQCDPVFKFLGDEFCPPNDRLAIYSAREPDLFPKLHQLIISGSKDIELAPKTKGFAIGLTLVRATNEPLFFEEETEIKPLALHDTLHPGDVRNDFYVTLLGGDFLQDKKKSAKNVEIRVQVVTGSGYVVPDCIARGAGPAAQPVSEYCSTVYYHSNSPELHETLSLRLNSQVFSQSHLLLTMWHVSTNAGKHSLFSFAFLPLTCKSGAVIADGVHALPCYVPIRNLDNGQAALQYLLAEEMIKTDRDKKTSPVLVRRKEEVYLHTRLSSVTKTQLDSLHALFNWRTLDASQVSAVMSKFLMISGSELVKFVRETFDSLFAMLCVGNYQEDVASQVFVGLLYTIDQLTTRMTSWRPTVSSYVNDVFKASGVHVVLLDMCIDTIDYAPIHSTASDMKRLKKLTMLCKCLEYMLKFIIAGFSLQMSEAEEAFVAQNPDAELRKQFDSEQDRVCADFKQRVMVLLQSVTTLLAHQGGVKDPLVGCKAFILKSFSSTLHDLSTIYNPTELGQIVEKVLSSVGQAEQSKLALYKLKLIGDIVEADVGVRWDAIEQAVLSALRVHLSQNSYVDEQYLSVGVLSRVLRMLQNPASADDDEGVVFAAAAADDDNDHDHDDADALAPLDDVEPDEGVHTAPRTDADLFRPGNFAKLKAKPFGPILPELIELFLHLQRSQVLQRPIAPPSEQVLHMLADVDMLEDSLTALWTILHFMKSDEFHELLQALSSESASSMGGSVNARDAFIMNLLDVCLFASQNDIYPSIWIVLRSFQLSIVSRILKDVSSILCDELRPGAPLNVPMWSRFFSASIALASHADLQDVSQEQRQFVSSDIRVDCLSLIGEVWSKAVAVQRQSDLVAFFCQKMLLELSDGGAHDLAMNMLVDLMTEEYERTGELAEVARYVVDALDAITNHSQESAEQFVSKLHASLKPRLAPLEPAGSRFLEHLKTLFELMCALFRFPKTEAYEHERTGVVIRLLRYLQSGDGEGRRKAMLYRYMQYLVDLHVSMCSFAEAGITQLQQANLLDWSDQVITAHGCSAAAAAAAAETEMQRKENLLQSAIALFVDGQCWERAIQVCEQLRQHYEHGIYDYAKLAATLERQALLYRNIASGTLRFYPAYFRVVFYSEGSRDEYVYRGSTLESVMDFCSRIRAKYADAHLVMSSDEPAAELLADKHLVITVTTLSISSDAAMNGETPANDLSRLPEDAARYRRNNDVSVFLYSKAEIRSAEKKPANEFKDLWVTRTYIRTEESFPSNRKRIEVVERRHKLVEPADVAVDTILNKNKELTEKIEQVQLAPTSEPVDVGPLSMNLNGILDAAVNGGTRKYIEAFLSSESAAAPASQRALKLAMVEQQRLLRKGLKVFAGRRDPALDPLYNRLRELFHRMVNTTKDLLQ